MSNFLYNSIFSLIFNKHSAANTLVNTSFLQLVMKYVLLKLGTEKAVMLIVLSFL